MYFAPLMESRQNEAAQLKTEVLICGAGPAGVSTALFLAKAGIPHILVDKAVFPRDKICGDALSGKVVEVMKKLDPQLLRNLEADKEHFLGSWGVQFVAPNGKALDIPFKTQVSDNDHAPGFISRRLDFDYHLIKLLDTKYTTFIQDCKVNLQVRSGDETIVSAERSGTPFQIKSKIVVAADGNQSIWGRKLGHVKDPKHHCAGIRAYYKNVSGLHPQNFIELHFLEELLPGYFWIFPLADGSANVGAGMLTKSLSRNKFKLKEAMLKAIRENPNIRHRFANAELEGKIEGWGLPLGSKKRSLSSDGLILTGDAASLIDPFTGEGIGNAMLSGMVAAQTVEAALKENKFDAAFLKQYDNEIYRRLWSELKLSHTLQRLSGQKWLFNFVVNKASRNKTLQETISCMFEDLDMRARLRKPSFYFKLLFGG